MGKYELSEEAKNDLVRIHQYGVLNFGELQADKYFFALFVQLDKIAHNPNLFQAVDSIRSGYRRCVFGSDSIYYRVHRDSVQIIRIIGKQDYRL